MKKLLLSFLAFATVLTSVAQVTFLINPPSVNAGGYSLTWADAAGGDWSMPDPTDPANAVEDTVVIYRDTLACAPALNASEIDGQIAMVFRTDCQFGVKAFNAQNAGAVAVIIVNDEPGLVNMAGGTDGPNVTIPVIMVETNTGDLLYDEITNGGTVTAFIGNKFGYFGDDIGISQSDVLRARQFATPIGLAADNTEFSVPLGAWIYNYGANDQTNVSINATVTLAGNVIYDEDVLAGTLLSTDSIWVALPVFSMATYSQDYYSVEYTVSSDATDEFDFDNEVNADFMFTENEYSYGTVDPVTSMPVVGQYTRINEFSVVFGACTHFSDPNASRKAALGMTFSATTGTDISLINELITLEVFEWNDPVTDFNDDDFNISQLDGIAQGEYIYSEDLQEEQIYIPFTNPSNTSEETPIVLEDNKHYLFCVQSNSEEVFIGYDNTLDYDENIRGIDNDGVTFHGDGHITTVGRSNNNWTSLAFGTDLSASTLINMVDVTELGIEQEETVKLDNAYPNPAVDMITVPLNGLTGVGTLNIVDVSGKVVYNEQVNLSASKLMIDVTDIPSGMYVFNLNLENGKRSTFNVVVSK